MEMKHEVLYDARLIEHGQVLIPLRFPQQDGSNMETFVRVPLESLRTKQVTDDDGNIQTVDITDDERDTLLQSAIASVVAEHAPGAADVDASVKAHEADPVLSFLEKWQAKG